MGVITCDKRGCNGILCDHRSYKHGDICTDCLEELRSLLVGRCISEFSEITCDFMNDDLGDSNEAGEHLVEQYLKEEFIGDEFE